ncbi:MAG: hypothetical protein PSV16_09985 [Flavobacterium sp.]|nr:hypothetical protein [Flavobacterium sp.]
MVSITQTTDSFVFEILGMHKLWTFENKITVAKNNVVKAYFNNDPIPFWKGWRAPGTEIPGIIVAGTFYKNGPNFWDVVNKRNTITVELENERYKKLIIEVKDPQAAINILTAI